MTAGCARRPCRSSRRAACVMEAESRRAVNRDHLREQLQPALHRPAHRDDFIRQQGAASHRQSRRHSQHDDALQLLLDRKLAKPRHQLVTRAAVDAVSCTIRARLSSFELTCKPDLAVASRLISNFTLESTTMRLIRPAALAEARHVPDGQDGFMPHLAQHGTQPLLIRRHRQTECDTVRRPCQSLRRLTTNSLPPIVLPSTTRSNALPNGSGPTMQIPTGFMSHRLGPLHKAGELVEERRFYFVLAAALRPQGTAVVWVSATDAPPDATPAVRRGRALSQKVHEILPKTFRVVIVLTSPGEAGNSA